MDIDFDHQGNMYVLDSSKKQILVFHEDGEYLHCFGQSKHSDTERLCVCGDFMYATEWATLCVSVFHPSLKCVGSFGKRGSGRGELYYPRCIAIAIVVADRWECPV